MNEKEYKELLEEVKNLRNQISWLSRRLELLYEYFEYYFPPFPPLDEEELWFRMWRKYIREKGISIDEWVEEYKEEIRSVSRTFRKHEISPQDATFYLCRCLSAGIDFIASKALLGSCECGGQLQLLVKDNTVYLTCAKCGRWLWQGLKRE